MNLIKDILITFKGLHKKTFLILKIGTLLTLALLTVSIISYNIPNISLLSATILHQETTEAAPAIFAVTSIFAFLFEAASRN